MVKGKTKEKQTAHVTLEVPIEGYAATDGTLQRLRTTLKKEWQKMGINIPKSLLMDVDVQNALELEEGYKGRRMIRRPIAIFTTKNGVRTARWIRHHYASDVHLSEKPLTLMMDGTIMSKASGSTDRMEYEGQFYNED